MKIICIGRNFSDHAKEMNAEQPSEPVFFIKPETAFTSQTELKIPEFTNNLNYELELVFRISKTASNVVESDALAYFDAWTLGIDFTARDIQEELKAKRLPWEKAKAFDCSHTRVTNLEGGPTWVAQILTTLRPQDGAINGVELVKVQAHYVV